MISTDGVRVELFHKVIPEMLIQFPLYYWDRLFNVNNRHGVPETGEAVEIKIPSRVT